MIPGSIVLSRFSHDLVGIGKHQDAPELSDIKLNTALLPDFQSNEEGSAPRVRDHEVRRVMLKIYLIISVLQIDKR